MKKNIYTSIFCTILGLCINTPAKASLISRGFLDQALTDYATTTALDLKANQSDLTDLSNKIGTLPKGDLTGNSPAMDTLFKYTQNTDTPVYPNSLSDLINQLYGNTEDGPGAISALLHGFDYEGFADEYGAPVGILPAMQLGSSATIMAKTAQKTATEAKTAADANTTAIGTLPTEYATVGAALSAIKGIAEEAKAAALAAIPDPKTEGSNGKYVLTVDIIGDNATYRWEPIDRGNTTTTTE